MGSAIPLLDIICIALNAFLVAVIPLQCHLNTGTVFAIRVEMHDFIETETPLLVSAPSPESQLSPIKTDSGFLITSPEFQMKRLLAGGFEKIYQLARCFRESETGPLHNQEFTMLEWYRSNEALEVLMLDIEQIVMHLSGTIGAENFPEKVPLPPWPRVTVCSLFKKHLSLIMFLCFM